METKLKFKGTPGPWYTTPHNHIKAENHEPIAHVFGYETYNARLIAAAPELLEVSQEMASELKRISGLLKGLKNSSLIYKAEAVIKKALEEQ